MAGESPADAAIAAAAGEAVSPAVRDIEQAVVHVIEEELPKVEAALEADVVARVEAEVHTEVPVVEHDAEAVVHTAEQVVEHPQTEVPALAHEAEHVVSETGDALSRAVEDGNKAVEAAEAKLVAAYHAAKGGAHSLLHGDSTYVTIPGDGRTPTRQEQLVDTR